MLIIGWVYQIRHMIVLEKHTTEILDGEHTQIFRFGNIMQFYSVGVKALFTFENLWPLTIFFNGPHAPTRRLSDNSLNHTCYFIGKQVYIEIP